MVDWLRTAILFALHAADLPASHIYRRDDVPSSALPDSDNTQESAMFIAEPTWRAIIVDTKGIGDDSDSDSAGTDMTTGGDSSGGSAGDDVMTGNVDGTGTEGE
ncbi:hypothetical protein EV421DRAFT_1911861 [Armillaria borealis]|uniref:Uncharacterized protein n=1 Tax=Armillaria borealis TaxID=47425 RepID=A0AA39ME35_9AGAR|nr:hypothetical protein EV421DRAFT_1911861 [Armillaria borealis]